MSGEKTFSKTKKKEKGKKKREKKISNTATNLVQSAQIEQRLALIDLEIARAKHVLHAALQHAQRNKDNLEVALSNTVFTMKKVNK